MVLAAEGSSFAADDPNCPPGSWFCGDQAQQQAAPSAPAPAAEAAPAPAAATPAAAATPPPPVIVYQAPPSDPPPPYVYTPRDPPLHRTVAIGANLQLPLYTRVRDGGGAMGGVGGLLRWRPRGSVFAMQGEIASYFGKDYNGDKRSEFAMSGDIMFFVMPRKKTSLYFLGGLGFNTAHVNRGSANYVSDYYGGSGGYQIQPSSSNFAYFTAQTGIGLEIGLGNHFALDFQLRGFVRQRIDSSPEPEFVSSSGRTTNASAGGLLLGGLTYYF